MSINKNLDFKTFFPQEKFKDNSQKKFKILINKVKENIEISNNIFNTLSKNFKLSFNSS